MNKYLYAVVGTLILTACTDKIQELENSCNANNGNDCLELAHIYETGKEVQQDNLKAMEFYKKTCDAGDVSICLLVAKTYFNGENGITKNNSEGTIYSEKACVLGNVQTCYDVAKSYHDGIISEKNITKSLFYHDKACEMGYGASCVDLATIYLTGDDELKSDKEKSLEYAKKGCELNISSACYGEGALYVEKKEYQTAMPSLKKACELDSADACTVFINLVANNIDSNILSNLDVKNAAVKLCSLDNGYGCKVLASYYLSDNNLTKRDPKEALRLFIKACDLKEADACVISAKLYGSEVKETELSEDKEKAKIFYKKACDLGSEEGCLAFNETGKWLEAVSKDKFTGNTRTIYVNSSIDSFYNDLGVEKKPVIMAGCDNNTTNVVISFDTVITCGDDEKIGLKFDDEQPYYEYWDGSTSCKALFSPQPIKFLKKMIGKKHLMVRFTPHGSGNRDVTFDIRGIDKVVEKLSNACRWKK